MPKERGPGDGQPWWSESRQRWIQRVELPPAASGRRRRKEVRGRTKTECLDKVRRVRRQIEDGLPLGDGRVTVSAMLDEWLERGLANVEDSTRGNARWAVDEHIRPALGARKVKDLSPQDVEDWLASLTTVRRVGQRRVADVPAAQLAKLRRRGAIEQVGYSGSTIARVHDRLTQALRWAQRRGYVARNVSELVDTPSGPSKTRRALTVGQARAFLRAAESDPLYAAVATYVVLGLRPLELRTLRWEDVDLANGVLYVRRWLKRDWSRRGLEAPQWLTDVLTEHAAAQGTRRIEAGDTWQDNGLVFCTDHGTPLDRSNVRRTVRRIAKAAGVGELTTYELRHSAASILYAAGTPPERVADFLGQKGIKTFEAVYKHLIEPTTGVAKTVMADLRLTVDVQPTSGVQPDAAPAADASS